MRSGARSALFGQPRRDQEIERMLARDVERRKRSAEKQRRRRESQCTAERTASEVEIWLERGYGRGLSACNPLPASYARPLPKMHYAPSPVP